MFKTNAKIQNGMYGINEYSEKKQKMVFKPLGKAVYIESITRDIETNTVKFILSWDYLGEKIYFEFTRRSISDHSLLQDLIEAGADVTKKNFNTFVDTLRLQELDIEASGAGSQKVYSHLGWKTVLVPKANGGTAKKLCYRAATMLGPCNAEYVGPLKIQPMGTFEAWKDMVEKEFIGHTPAEVVMLAGLSAVINGLISTHTTGETAIVHICGGTGSGKSSVAQGCVAAYGEPFDGSRTAYDKSGMPVIQQSLYGSWSATENAAIARCAGNRGSLIVWNELGKFRGNDLSSLIYNVSEGTDKLRMNKALEINQSEGFSTTIMSVGELSLLDKCQSKADGLRIRVLELDMKMSKSAESADRIKDISRKNNGWAAPMLAEYIINNGGLKMVLDIYYRWRSDLLAIWPDTPSKERFVSKFPALFLTTAELAKAALGITFSEQAIIDFFIDREATHGKNRNSAATSYEFILSQCRIRSHHFYVRTDRSIKTSATFQQPTIPNNDCWGRITYMSKFWSDNRVIIQEFEVRKVVVEEILAKNGFTNKKTCIEAWRAADVLDYQDDTHPCRKRKIDPASPDGATEPVYVFRVFCDPADVDKHWAAVVDEEQQKQLQIIPLKANIHTKKEADGDDPQNAHSA